MNTLESLIRPFYNPRAPSLSDVDLEAAKEDNVVSYTQVIRSVGESTDGYAVLSFLVTDDGPSYVKLRGVSQTKEGCNKIATKVLKHVDSKIPLVYVRAGAWIPVTNYPKRIASEQFKVVDDTLVPDRVSEVDKCERVLEQYYQNEDAERAREMERRRALLSAQTVDEDVNAYVVKKMMLHETRKHKRFILEKLELMREREVALVDLMSWDVAHESNWRAEYETQLAKIGQTPGTLDADYEPTQRFTRQECLDNLKTITDRFNNLKF